MYKGHEPVRSQTNSSEQAIVFPFFGNHRASNCPSRSDCQRYHKCDHTSIFDTIHPTSDANKSATVTRGVTLTTNQIEEGLFPVIIVEVNGIKCRAIMDSEAGS